MGNQGDAPPSYPGEPVVCTEFTDDESLTAVIVRALAAVEDAGPMELPPLNDAVDPDALSALFDPLAETATSELTVEFTAIGYRVHVTHDGQIVLFADDTA